MVCANKNDHMDLSKISNNTVRKAIEALQAGSASWYGYFTADPEMMDDGRPVDFRSFFAKALGTEKFIDIDRVEDDGKSVYGRFNAGQWGVFRTYFKFTVNADGLISHLAIGQA